MNKMQHLNTKHVVGGGNRTNIRSE